MKFKLNTKQQAAYLQELDTLSIELYETQVDLYSLIDAVEICHEEQYAFNINYILDSIESLNKLVNKHY